VARCGDGIQRTDSTPEGNDYEQCDDGNQREAGWYDGDADWCDTNCQALPPNAMSASVQAAEEAQAQGAHEAWGARYEAMTQAYKPPSVAPCFQGTKELEPPPAMLNEVARHFDVSTDKLEAEHKDRDGDGRADWFISIKGGYSAWGPLGSLFIPSSCSPQAWCYASSGQKGALRTEPKLRCRTHLIIDESEDITNRHCTFQPAPAECVEPDIEWHGDEPE
jgi:hypothetical protein